MEVKETVLSNPQEHLTSLIEESLRHTKGSNDVDREKARVFIPEVRKANEQYLKRFSINLSTLESNGFSPWGGTGRGDMDVLPAGEDSAFLLVRSVEDLSRERSDPKYRAPQYLVMNGQVNKQLYLQHEYDGETGNSWVLTDMRDGKINKQTMRIHFVDDGPGHMSGEWDVAHLDGKEIWPLYAGGHGYSIGIRSDFVQPSETKVEPPTGWIKKIL